MLPTHRPPTHPGEMLLREFLEPLGVSQVEAANRMNIPFQRLNAIVKGRRAVSADTALLLEALEDARAPLWRRLTGRFFHRRLHPVCTPIRGSRRLTADDEGCDIHGGGLGGCG